MKMKKSKSPEGGVLGAEDDGSLGGNIDDSMTIQAHQQNPRIYSKISTFRGPNP